MERKMKLLEVPSSQSSEVRNYKQHGMYVTVIIAAYIYEGYLESNLR
jgi:hypothetical protein